MVKCATSFMDIISMLSIDPKTNMDTAEQPGKLTIDPEAVLSSLIWFFKNLLDNGGFSSQNFFN